MADSPPPPSSGPSDYRYEILSEPKTTIRLLRLQPGSGINQVKAELVNDVPLSSPPAYEALSYAWDKVPASMDQRLEGDKTPVQIFSNSGQVLGAILVSDGLIQALYQLRYSKSTPRLLWIDQLCINQSESGEVTSQLKIMRSIYEKASQTIVWLGKGSASDGEAISTITGCCDHRKEVERSAANLLSHLRQEAFKVGVETASLNRANLIASLITNAAGAPTSSCSTSLDFSESQLKDVLNFYQRRWFSRLWPFQEVVVSSKILVSCGVRNLSWEDIGFFAFWLIHHWKGRQLTDEEKRGLETAEYYYWYRMKGEKRDPLVEVLRAGRRCDTEKKADKVFAVIGLAEMEAAALIDTSKDYRSIYIDVARYMVRKDGDLQALAFVQHVKSSYFNPSNTQLPSWVPDWSQPEEVSLLWLPESSPDMNFSSGPNQHIPYEIPHGPDELPVRGRSIETITRIYHPLFERSFGAGGKPEWSGIIRWIFEDCDSCFSAPLFRTPLKWTKADHQTCRHLIDDQSVVLTGGRTQGGRIVRRDDSAYGYDHEDVVQHRHDYCAFLSMLSHYESGYDAKRLRPFKRLVEFAEPFAAKGNADRYSQQVINYCRNRTLFRTHHGRLGLGPLVAKEGDEIWIFHGGKIPFLLRHLGDNDSDRWSLAGACYLSSWMFARFNGSRRIILC